MGATHRIEIIVDNQRIDYKSAEDLGIKFNRIVNDMKDITKRFGDFSYSFDLPITKNNAKIFRYANARNRKDIFRPNRNLSCRIYNNNRLLLDGIISLTNISTKSFSCVLFSKLKEFTDAIEDKNLRDIEFDEISFDYESTIINHIKSNYHNSDDTIWQFPFIFYSTYFTPYGVYSGNTDFNGAEFYASELEYQQYYYALNNLSGNTENEFYHHQFPPAFYIVRIIEQIFKDAGWTLGGQFWEDENVKKIVMLYGGDNDIYDQATGVVSGSTAVDLQPAKLLPDMTQVEFISGLINVFNLYFNIDIDNKIIHFETYSKMFGDLYNPYDITNKIFLDSVVFEYEENNDPNIRFEKSLNRRIFGDNKIITGDTNNIVDMNWKKISDKHFDNIVNKIGDSKIKIKLPFGEPTIKRQYIWNHKNSGSTITNTKSHQIFIPILSKQTQDDNDNLPFNKNTGQTSIYNTEQTIKYNNKPVLMYYYGKSNSDYINYSGKGYASNYYYVNMPTGSTNNVLPIGICSPYMISNNLDSINDYLNDPDSLDNKKTIIASYLKTLWALIGTSGSTYTGTTDFSLVFDDNGYFHKTLWSEFHKPMYDRFQTSEILNANMKMNEYDWNEMQINRPIKYNGEIYHIISISGYDPINKLATIKLIKI